MGSVFGRSFQVVTFGESHGPAVGVVIDAVPPGIPLDAAVIQRELDRRRPGTSRFVSPRQEMDQVEILSGVAQGKTMGTPFPCWSATRMRDLRIIRQYVN
jgi:chorismate synthase